MDKNLNEKEMYMNYIRVNKWLGIIDYKSLICVLIYVFFIGYIISLLPFNIEVLIYIFLFFVLPVIAVICLNTNNQNINAIDILQIILKFKLNSKIFVRLEDKKYFKPQKFKNHLQ